MNLDELITFPIVMIDGDNEEKKQERSESLALGEPSDYDIIYAEAECPYWDFLCVNDRWLPSSESFEKARGGEFEACSVSFGQCGTFCVPMSKDKWKKKLRAFIAKLPEKKPIFFELTKEQVDLLKKKDEAE